MPYFEFAKSSHSSGNGECVEVARNRPHTVALRDSKTARGPVLQVTPGTWTTFIQALGRKPVASLPGHPLPSPHAARPSTPVHHDDAGSPPAR